MTAFAGWLMPLRYSSETAEHRAVRSAAGLFDLSHMGELFVSGPDAAAALDFALVGELSAVSPGRARYTMICAADGGVLDDLIVYRLGETEFLVVANASNTPAVDSLLRERAGNRNVQITNRTADYALIAVQGPAAAGILSALTPAPLESLKYYASEPAKVAGTEVLLARTGYTGEDGFELFTPAAEAAHVWSDLAAAGAGSGLVPAGLAARDTLRLEAGMPLYGNELGPDTTPYDAGLGRVVKLGKPGDFVGKAALATASQAPPRRALAGLTALTRRVPRHGYRVLWDGEPCGTVTSGAPSPTLGVPIAMAYIEPRVADLAQGDDAGGRLAVNVRGSAEPARMTALPFYHRSH
jgi:aminomethyltransferase